MALTDNNVEETIELLEENGAKLKSLGAPAAGSAGGQQAMPGGEQADSGSSLDAMPPVLGLVEAVAVLPQPAGPLLAPKSQYQRQRPRKALAVYHSAADGSVNDEQPASARRKSVGPEPLLSPRTRTRPSSRGSSSAAAIGTRSATRPTNPSRAKQPAASQRKRQRTTPAADGAGRPKLAEPDYSDVTDVPSDMLGKRVVCLFIIKSKPVWYGCLVTNVPEPHHQHWPFVTVKVDDGDKQHVLIRDSNMVQDEHHATVTANPKEHAPCGGVWYFEAEGEWRDESVFFVERILDKRRGAGGQIQYLVKWWSYAVDESTWEPDKNCMEDSAIAVKEFEAAQVSGPVLCSVLSCCETLVSHYAVMA